MSAPDTPPAETTAVRDAARVAAPTPPATSLRERLEAAVGLAALRLPRRLQRLLVGQPTRADGLQLDVTSQLLLWLQRVGDVPPVESLSVDAARAQAVAQARLLTRPGSPSLARVEELEIPGLAGPMPARLYAPAPDPDAGGLLVYYHGGGHVIGSLETHDSACRFLARAAGVGVLSVDYRLAPEHPFPAAVEDAVAALAFAAVEAERLGFDARRIGVGGDSAGGNLAAVAALAAKAGEAPLPAFQLLIYPVCDFAEKRRSYELFDSGYLLSAADMDWYRDHYLPDPESRSDWRASPLHAPDLSGLPPAYVLTAGFDPLRDEGEEYASRVRDAGVPVALRRHEGLLHSFANQTAFNRAARDAMLEAAGALRLGLAAR